MAFYSNYAYEASAGSGKTFALVVRYITLLFMDAKPESILALTFTNKAANEMRVRIGSVLKELHLEKRDAELSEIAKALEVDKSEILLRQKEVLRCFLTSNLMISTIDKFFAQILRKFSLHLGLMPDFSIDESSDEEKFLKKFISLIKKEAKYKELVEFSVYEDKRLKSIFDFLENLYEKDSEISDLSIKKGDIFAIESKLISLGGDLYELLSMDDKLSNRAKKSLKYESIEQLSKKSWICKDSLEYWDYRSCFTPRADELLMEIKECLSIYYEIKEGYFKDNYLSLYSIYKQSKYELNVSTNLLRFNDVSYFVYQLLRGRIDSEFLYFRLDSKIDHLLIDEFQDTNILQFKILEPIIDEINSGIGVKEFRTFFYVGDIKQSIYRFRGGAKELFNYVAKHYGVKVEKLSVNYRSKTNIVEFVNGVFLQKIKNYTPQHSLESFRGGYVKVVEGEDTLDMVVESLFYLLNQGAKVDDIAILTHANSDAYMIEKALLEKDSKLDITTQTSIKLINNPKVSAVIELLKYLYFKDELFRANFLSSIGLDPKSDIDLSSFKITTELPTLIKEIIDYFKIFNRDENLLKLITISASYSDIESFLFESEDISVDSPSKKSSGLRILTIHKSKGLEFEHLIVADRFKKKSSDKSSMVFSYDDVHLSDMYVKFKSRECVDSEYAKAIEKNKNLIYEDDLNLQYVAFTRAKESLIVCKKEKDSTFDSLGLKEIEIGSVDIEVVSKSDEVSEVFEYESIRVGPQQDTNTKEKDQKDDIAAINFGLALHYMLEILEKFEKDCINQAYWAMKNRYEILLVDGECEKIRDRVLALLNHQPFLELVDANIYKEQPISYNGELKQIDLLVQKDDKYIVIDYKSSATQHSSHVKQVALYKEAIKKITDKEVEAYLCYVRADEVELVKV
jgi:exodeoxyribonuclease V beta subunit